jgi:hypothetical protein
MGRATLLKRNSHQCPHQAARVVFRPLALRSRSDMVQRDVADQPCAQRCIGGDQCVQRTLDQFSTVASSRRGSHRAATLATSIAFSQK